MKSKRMEDQKAILEYKIDEGKAVGKVESRIESETIGLEKGKVEGKIEVAKQLLQDGFGMDMIARATGLDKKQIEKLQKYILDGTTAVNF